MAFRPTEKQRKMKQGEASLRPTGKTKKDEASLRPTGKIKKDEAGRDGISPYKEAQTADAITIERLE